VPRSTVHGEDVGAGCDGGLDEFVCQSAFRSGLFDTQKGA
jgi:hypothetical protein